MASYDEFVSEAVLQRGEQVLARLVHSRAGEDTQDLELVVSVATVSAHWLLCDDGGARLRNQNGLSRTVRAHYEEGLVPDGDLIDWVIGICSLLVVDVVCGDVERASAVRTLASTTGLGAALEEAADQLAIAGAPELGEVYCWPLVRRACELLIEALPAPERCAIDPVMLTTVRQRASEYATVRKGAPR